MKFKDFYEAITRKVFHASPIDYALGIMRSDKFVMSDAADDYDDLRINKGLGNKRRYYFSTARSTTSPYIRELMDFKGYSDALIIFELDGNKLGQVYKAGAVNYSGIIDPQEDYGKEFEDRVFSHKPRIDNASKYIDGIHIWARVPDSDKISQFTELAKQRGIPVWVYDNQKDWTHRDKRKAVEIK